MKEHTLNIGEVKTFDSPVTLTCYGLGSCVGLFMQDRNLGIAGGAHILLPENEKGPDGFNLWCNVTAAVSRMVEEFRRRGSTLTSMRAKITGGANTLQTSFCIGQRNIESVVTHLVRRNIYIAAIDVGGSVSRTARFVSETGALLVKTSDTKYYKIF